MKNFTTMKSRKMKGYLTKLFRHDLREEEEVLVSEVEWAIKELKRNKSPGSDNIRAELIQE